MLVSPAVGRVKPQANRTVPNSSPKGVVVWVSKQKQRAGNTKHTPAGVSCPQCPPPSLPKPDVVVPCPPSPTHTRFDDPNKSDLFFSSSRPPPSHHPPPFQSPAAEFLPSHRFFWLALSVFAIAVCASLCSLFLLLLVFLLRSSSLRRPRPLPPPQPLVLVPFPLLPPLWNLRRRPLHRRVRLLLRLNRRRPQRRSLLFRAPFQHLPHARQR